MPAGPAPEYAPFGGIVPNVVLQPGTRVNTGTAVMALIDSANPIINVQIAQNHLRYIRPGQEAEVTFPLYPGSTYPAKVTKIYRANASGQLQPSGLVASVNESGTERFNVTLTLEGPAPELPIGASGTAAIYTTEFTASHLFRRVILRMTAWLNFIMAG
ncbi:MAG: HlyD family secretion protein [Anderseniella sp.]